MQCFCFAVLSAVSGISSLGKGNNQFCTTLGYLINRFHDYLLFFFFERQSSLIVIMDGFPDAIVGISVAILIVLFSVQRFGTDKVGLSFAPIILLWFTFIGGIGLYNLFKYNPGVLRAFNPGYAVDYFRRNGKKGWISLGGIVLCITGDDYLPQCLLFSTILAPFLLSETTWLHETGTEAMFADLGHFNIRAIQVRAYTITMFLA